MSIDLTDKKIFSKNEKKLTEFLTGQKTDYYNSKVYQNLSNRMDKLKKSNDMDYGQDRFMSKIGFPIQKQVSLMRKMILDQNYASEQLYYIKETDETTTDIAKNQEDTINDNIRRTNFVQEDFNYIKLNTADYGVAVCFSFPASKLEPHFKTVAIPTERPEEPFVYERKRIEEEDRVIKCKNVFGKNYFQDPDACTPYETDVQGHIERWYISEFVNYTNNKKGKNLIQSNINEMIDRVKKSGAYDSHYKTTETGGQKNVSKTPVDITRMFSTCNIPGNEDNKSPYFIEMVGGKIIRIEKDMFDENLVPYTVFSIMIRSDAWWGNCDGEFVLSHENATNLLTGLKIDQAIRAQDMTMFHKKGSISIDDWNNKKSNGGFVGVDMDTDEKLESIIFPFQPVDQALSTYNDGMREINASRQSMASQPNVNQRVSKTAPLQNTTATAVQTMNEQGDIKEGSYTRQFDYGMKRLAYVILTMAIQTYPDQFKVLSSTGETKTLYKAEIMGSSQAVVRTALTNNKAFESNRLMNLLNSIMNLIGTQHPSTQAIKIAPLIKQYLDRADAGDISQIFDDDLNNKLEEMRVSQIMGQGQPGQGQPGTPQPGQPQVPQGVPNA